MGYHKGNCPSTLRSGDALPMAGTMDVSVEINCEICGSANYSLPAGGNDAGTVLCNDCGAEQGSLGELKAALAERVLEHSAEAKRRRLAALGGTGGRAPRRCRDSR